VTLGLQVGNVPELTTEPAYKPVVFDVDALVGAALRNRAEVVIEDLAVEDASAALRISRSDRKPALDVFGSSTTRADGEGGTDWTVGIRTSIPVGSWALSEAVRSAQRGWLLAQRGREEARQRITTEVRETARGLRSQEERIGILEKSLEVAREKLRLADVSVEEGIGLYRDKIEAQEQVTAAERDLLDAQISYYFGVLRLRRAVGGDVLQGLEQETVESAAAPPAAP
ncbi:MAG TPA: TolC family protein, partial [Armatimonadota bacterium]|nr:TolC family protein [Armatimonadota bacterium]